MAADESKAAKAEGDSWGSKNWTGAAFLPIGLVFITLEFDGNMTFLAFGTVFFILSMVMFTQGRETDETEAEPSAFLEAANEKQSEIPTLDSDSKEERP